MKKILSKLEEMIFIIIVIIDPVHLPYLTKKEMLPGEWVMAWAIFFIQLALLVVFFRWKPVWSKWILLRARQLEITPEKNLPVSVQTSFLIYCILIFGNVLPCLIYVSEVENYLYIYCMFIFALLVWMEMFFSKLYLVMTGDKEFPGLYWRFPWFSFFGVAAAVWNYPIPYNPTRISAIILIIFLVENMFLLTLRAHIVNRKRMTG